MARNVVAAQLTLNRFVLCNPVNSQGLGFRGFRVEGKGPVSLGYGAVHPEP